MCCKKYSKKTVTAFFGDVEKWCNIWMLYEIVLRLYIEVE